MKKSNLGGRRRGGGFDSRKTHATGEITADERKELEDLYNADTIESRAFRLDWTRVTNKPKVHAYLTRMCNTEESFKDVRVALACRLPGIYVA